MRKFKVCVLAFTAAALPMMLGLLAGVVPDPIETFLIGLSILCVVEALRIADEAGLLD